MPNHRNSKGSTGRLSQPDADSYKRVTASETACELMILPDYGGHEDLRAHDEIVVARVDPADVKHGIEIPHHPVHLDNGMISSELATTDYVKAMTHELRTPLNVIIGLCQLLERDRKSRPSAMQRDAIQRMERNARALLETVNHLLACMRSGHFD